MVKWSLSDKSTKLSSSSSSKTPISSKPDEFDNAPSNILCNCCVDILQRDNLSVCNERADCKKFDNEIAPFSPILLPLKSKYDNCSKCDLIPDVAGL